MLIVTGTMGYKGIETSYLPRTGSIITTTAIPGSAKQTTKFTWIVNAFRLFSSLAFVVVAGIFLLNFFVCCNVLFVVFSISVCFCLVYLSPLRFNTNHICHDELLPCRNRTYWYIMFILIVHNTTTKNRTEQQRPNNNNNNKKRRAK